VSVMPVLLHPKSMGEVLLRSSNPEEPLLIQPNYLAHPQDVETLYHGTSVNCVKFMEIIYSFRSRIFQCHDLSLITHVPDLLYFQELSW